MSFDRLVFWSGVWNIALGIILVTPAINQLLGMQIPNPFWPWIAAAFLWFTSAVLILSSRNVTQYAAFIYWEAILRFAAVAILLVYGLTYVGVLAATVFLITDFAWGLCYVVGLPRVTGRTHASLLLDQQG